MNENMTLRVNKKKYLLPKVQYKDASKRMEKPSPNSETINREKWKQKTRSAAKVFGHRAKCGKIVRTAFNHMPWPTGLPHIVSIVGPAVQPASLK